MTTATSEYMYSVQACVFYKIAHFTLPVCQEMAHIILLESLDHTAKLADLTAAY